MKTNALKALWQAGRPVINGWLSVGNAFTAEIMAAQDYDVLTVDVQHGALDYPAMLAMFQAMGAAGKPLMARSPWLDPAAIMKILDAGAHGVICPMINNRAEAERLVSYVRYPPDGTRSYGPSRAKVSLGPSYAPGEVNDQTLCFAMIETAEAYRNLDAIVTTPGLDGVYIGPADLTLGLTGQRYPVGFDREEPEMVAALQAILAAAHRAGIKAALHCGTPAYAARAVGWGFDLVTIGADASLLATAAREIVTSTRQLIGAGA